MPSRCIRIEKLSKNALHNLRVKSAATTMNLKVVCDLLPIRLFPVVFYTTITYWMIGKCACILYLK